MEKPNKKRKEAGSGVWTRVARTIAAVEGRPFSYRRDWFWGLILILFVILAYMPIWHAGFIWDDDIILTANPCIVGPLGLKEIWTTSAADICPLAITTFWLEHALWGLGPLPYHLVNILMHGACAVLLWRVLRSLRVQGAWLGAGLWALHPVEVESVAWIAEMKNTESTLFFLLSILFFIRCLRAEELNRRNRGGWDYGLSLLFAALAMASKSSTVILPVVLCLCAWWVEGGWHWRNVARVLPMLLMSAAASAVSIWTQGLQLATGTAPQWVRTWPERMAAAGDAGWFYLGKLLWPDPLITIYPRWRIDAGQWVSYLPLLVVILIFLILWLTLRSGVAGSRACFFAFAYFMTALLPVLGLIDNYIFRYSLVFDHFQYLASIGPLALASAGLAGTWEKRIGVSDFAKASSDRSAYRGIGVAAGISQDKLLTRMGPVLQGWRTPNKNSLGDLRGLLCRFFFVPSTHIATQLRILASKNPWLGPALCAGLLLVLGMASWQRTWVFKSEETLWSDTLAKYPECWVGYASLGYARLQKGQLGEAIEQYQMGLQIYPDYADGHYNLGLAFVQEGKLDEAIAQYQKAVEINPNYAEAYNNLGNTLFRKGQLAEAVAQYQMAVKINPKYAQAHTNLGAAFFREGALDDAIAQFQKALEIDPNYAEAHTNLGLALVQKGQLGEAIEQYQIALKIDPLAALAHANLGLAFVQEGKLDEAIAQYQKAVEINPNYAEAYNNLGNTLFRKGQLAEAVAQYQMAVKINPKYAQAHTDLGAAFFREGALDDAIAQFQKALEIDPNYAEAHTNLGLALVQKGQLDEAIEHYQIALEIDPLAALAHANLGLAFIRQGDIDDGIAQLQEALRLNPNLSGVRDSIAKAKGLESKK